MRISIFIGEAKIHRYAALLYCRSSGGLLALDDAQQLALIDREVDVDRIKLIDLAEGGLLSRGPDQVSGIDEMSAHPAVERRPDHSVTQIELGELHLGLRIEEPGFGRFFLIPPLVHLGLRCGIFFEQRRVPYQLRVGVPQ
jgi:hypothetical protein